MRTFHTGGVAGDDITQGLPSVEELFEAENQRDLQLFQKLVGTVRLNETKKEKRSIVTAEDGEAKNYLIPYGSRLKVSDG